MKRGENESQYARSLIEASRDPLITINTAGKITDMNQATVNITGMSREELTGTDFFDYFTEPQKAREVYQEVFARGFVADYPLTMRDVKSTEVLFNGSVYKDKSGNVAGVVVVARDITEQKRIERELIEAIVFAELATGIAEEAKTKAEEATRVAEHAVKAKQQFLSNMSHEIRTPMNSIVGFTKVILRTNLTPKQKEYITAIKISGDALIVVINDILDLAKVDAGKMTFEKTPFKLSDSILSMLHLFETETQEKNLAFLKVLDPGIPEVLVGDPIRLRQIILNLVSNAVKFTNTGGITVSVRLLYEDEKRVTVEFAVKDTGMGIPADKLEQIFENFQQASRGTSRLFGGTGLGLAIVKHLVEAQNGSIHVKSTIGEGSTFSFVLEFLKSPETVLPEPEMTGLRSWNRSIKILVVEDIPFNQLLLRTLLDDFGFESHFAQNGKIALEMLSSANANNSQGPYEIILMDLQMPEMDGFETTMHIRNTLNLSVPILALSADVTTADASKCIEAGMNGYITKPIDENALFKKIVTLAMANLTATAVGSAGLLSFPEKFADLKFLDQRTKSNPNRMFEMISLYLGQTPGLVLAMNEGLQNKDWNLVRAAVHKMIPSFVIMGVGADCEKIAKQILESSRKDPDGTDIVRLIARLSVICNNACEELKEELRAIKNQINEPRTQN